MRRNLRISVIVLVIAALTVGSAATAFAQDGDDSGRQGPRFKGWGMQTVMEFLDVSKGDVISTLRTGGTLAELAEENGSSGEELVAALVAVVEDRLDEAVANGRITEEEAAEMLAEAEARITNFVYSTHDGPDPHSRKHKGWAMAVVMETLDVNRGQVTSMLRSGGTLAELAEENGSSGEELVAALVAVVEDRLEEAVANGRITEEEAAEMLADAEDRITNFVYSTHDGPRGNGAPASA